MDFEFCLAQMSQNAATIQQLVEGVSVEQSRWRPDAESWSILEVVTHLYDEEREDFRVRLDTILHRPDEVWPSIDPAGWVAARAYNERDLGMSLIGFLQERQNSLDWLRQLKRPDWSQTSLAPWGGPLRAGDMLTAWVAHDLLHLRQLIELQYAYATAYLAPYEARYAGEW